MQSEMPRENVGRAKGIPCPCRESWAEQKVFCARAHECECVMVLAVEQTIERQIARERER